MNIVKSIVDNVGDMLGTSKLAKLNANVFKPVIGLSITRNEYDMCDGQNLFLVPDKEYTNHLKGLNDYARHHKAEKILGTMVDNGTVFSDQRIIYVADALQTTPGENALPFKLHQQMTSPGKMYLDEVLQRQLINPLIR